MTNCKTLFSILLPILLYLISSPALASTFFWVNSVDSQKLSDFTNDTIPIAYQNEIKKLEENILNYKKKKKWQKLILAQREMARILSEFRHPKTSNYLDSAAFYNAYIHEGAYIKLEKSYLEKAKQLIQEEEYTEALTYYAVLEKIGKDYDYMINFNAIQEGRLDCYANLKQLEQAIEVCEQRVKYSQDLLLNKKLSYIERKNIKEDIATNYFIWGQLELKCNRPDNAIKYFHEYLFWSIEKFKQRDIYKSPKYTDIVAINTNILNSLNYKGFAFFEKYERKKNQEDLQAAYENYSLLVRLMDEFRFGLSDLENNELLAFFENNTSLYENALKVSLTIYELREKKMYEEEAIEIIQRSKGFDLRNLLLTNYKEIENEYEKYVKDYAPRIIFDKKENGNSYACTYPNEALICEDFESYNINQFLGPQSPNWTTWNRKDGTEEDVIVAYNDSNLKSNKCIQIQGTKKDGGPQDLVLKLGDKTTGVYDIEFSMFIEDAAKGYYNIQHLFSRERGNEWASNVYFEGEGIGKLEIQGIKYIFSYPTNKWFTVRQRVDLDQDRTYFYIENEFVHLWKFSNQAKNKYKGAKQLSAVNFYPQDITSNFLIDNVSFSKLPNNISIDSFKLSYPEYYKLEHIAISSIERIQTKLDTSTVVVDYIFGKRKLYAGVIAKDTFFVKKLRGHKNLKRNSALFSNILSKPIGGDIITYIDLAQKLYQDLVSPVLFSSSIEKLIINPDDVLHQLPFEALLSDQISNRESYKKLPYLVNKYAIKYIYSTSLLSIQNDISKDSLLSNVLVMAPFTEGDKQETYPNKGDLDILRNSELGPLPAGKAEIAAIARYSKGEYFMNLEATKQNLLKKVKKCSILHLITHTLRDTLQNVAYLVLNSTSLDRKIKNNSFLDDYIKTKSFKRDNLLNNKEINEMSLNADLVILSACETGLGRSVKGEGLLSTARDFIFAGSPNVLMTMWRVEDKKSALLMGYFYEYLAKGFTIEVALQQAKIKLIDDSKGLKAHPFYWASYVKLGLN